VWLGLGGVDDTAGVEGESQHGRQYAPGSPARFPGMPATGVDRCPTTGPTTWSDRRVGLRWWAEGQGELLAGQAGDGISGPCSGAEAVGPCRRVRHHTRTADAKSPNSMPIAIGRRGLGWMGCSGTAARCDRLNSAASLICRSSHLWTPPQLRRDAGTLVPKAVVVRPAGRLDHVVGQGVLQPAPRRHDPELLGLALQLARDAGYRALGARVLTSMSHHALDLGDLQEASQLLHAAQGDAADSPALLAKAAVMEARLHARLGDTGPCEEALTVASRAFERSDPAHDPEWIANANEAYLAGQFGNCYLDLGQPARADPYLRSALAGYRPDYVRRRAMATTLLARCDLERGELEQACLAGVKAIDLAVRLKSRRALAGVSDLQQRLEPHHRERPVREFQEHAAALL
jgi:hypothetical protein